WALPSCGTWPRCTVDRSGSRATAKGAARPSVSGCPRNQYTDAMATAPSSAAVGQAIQALKARLGARATDAHAVREHHSHGESYHTPALPDVVCYPTSTEDVAAIAAIAAHHRLPIVPFGAGTSLEGHVNAIHGGITIDLREMKQVVRVSVEDLDATVEAGVT